MPTADTAGPHAGQQGWLQRLGLTSRTALTPYDALVVAMRLILPFSALVIGLVVLIMPLRTNRDPGFTFNREALSDLPGKVRVQKAHYTGADAMGRLFYVAADEATQDDPQAPTADLQLMWAEMDLEGGQKARIVAPTGVYTIGEKRLDVTGGMTLTTTSGYRLSTERASVDLETKYARSDQEVEGQSPLGRFKAGGFTMLADQRTAHLTGGVEMRLDPGSISQAGGQR